MDQLFITVSEEKPNAILYTVLSWYVLIGSILFNVIYFIFGLIAPKYDMMRQPIDHLELLNYGWIQSANFIQLGLTIVCCAIIFFKELQNGFGGWLIPIFQLFTAVLVILMGIFIHEPVHIYLSVIAVSTVIISFFLLAQRFAGEPKWKGWTAYTICSALLMVIFLLSFWYFDNRNGSYAGIPERLIVVTRLIWVIIFISKILNGCKLTQHNVARLKKSC